MKIDWTIFDNEPESTCYCVCEQVYRSHTKLKLEGKTFIHYSKKPCPKCKKTENNLRRVISDPEHYVITKK